MNTKFLVKNGIFLSVFLGAALLPYQEVIAQGDRPMSTPDRRVSRELWDIWRQGFEYYEKGEMKMIAGKYAESLPLYRKSLESFQEVRKQNPQWNRNVIEYRMNLCRRRLLTAGRRAEEAADAAKRSLNRAETVSAGTTAPDAVRTRPAAGTAAAADRDLDRQLRQAMQENALRKKQIEELQKEMTKLRPDAARAEVALQQINSLMKERANLEKQLASIKLQFENIQKEQRKNSPRTAELERLLAAEQNKSAAYAKAFRERSAESARLEGEVKAVSAELARLKNEHAELTRKYTAELQSSERIVRENSARQNSLAEALKKSETETLRLNESLARKNRELEQSAEELRVLRAGRISSSELTRKIETEAVALRDENRKIREELEKLRSERTGLEGRIAKLDGELDQTRRTLVLNIEQRNDFAKANDTISKQFSELEVSFRKMRDANVQLQKQLDAAIKERELLASKVNDQLSETLKNRLAAAQQEVQNRTAERDAAIREIAQLKQVGDPAALKADLAATENKLAEAERGRGELEVKLAEERKKLAVAAAALAASQGEVTALGARMQKLQLESGRATADASLKNQTVNGLTAELKGKKEKLAALEAETLRLRQKQAELTARLENNLAVNIKLQQQKDEIAARLEKSGADRSGLQTQYAETAARLKKAEEENSGLRAQQTRLAAQLSRQQRDSASALLASETARKQLQAQLQAQEKGEPAAVVAELRRQLAETSEKNRSLLTENNSLKSESRDLRDQAAGARLLRQENSKLKAESEGLRKQLAESKKQEKTAVPAPVPVPIPVPAADDSREKLAALEKQNAELKESSARADRELADARRQIDVLNRQMEDTVAKLVKETKTSESRQQEISQLKSSLALLEQKNSDSQAKLLRSRQTAANREKMRLDLLREISQLQKTLQATAEERSQLVKELDAVKAQLPTATALAAARTDREQALQENAKLQAEKTALENNIARLQARIGRSQEQMDKMRKVISGYESDVDRLRNTVLDLEKVKSDLDILQKETASLRKENQTVRENADTMERKLKSELQKQAAQLLAVREENTQYKDSVQQLTGERAELEKEKKLAQAQITDLKKQLVKALSEEEKVKLKKRIDELTATLRKLAEGSEDELVREAAAKNVVITDLLKEQESMKQQVRDLTRSAESYRILALRQREAADKAENEAKIALYDAKKTRGELKMLRADIEDGIVKVPESKRIAMNERRRRLDPPEAKPEAKNATAAKQTAGPEKPALTPAAPQPDKAAPVTGPEEKAEKPKEYLEAMKKGAEAEKSGDLGMALWHFWQAADLQDQDPEPYMALTRIHIKRKETESAMKSYKKAILNGGERDQELEKAFNQ